MIVEILCVGNELLEGITLNTNANWLAGQISRAGATVSRVTEIRDQLDHISATVLEILNRKPDILIITGGLGATYDDITLEGVANALGRKVAIDPRAKRMLKKSYVSRGLDPVLTEARLKMARIPEGSAPLQNMVGSAPAVYLRAMNADIFCLQGVPGEMEEAFQKYVLPKIRKIVGRFILLEASFDISGVTEATLAPSLSEIVASTKKEFVYIKTHPRGYHGKVARIRVHIISRGSPAPLVRKRLEDTSSAISRVVETLGGSWKKTG